MTLEQQTWAEIHQRRIDWYLKRPAPKVDIPKTLLTAAVIVAAHGGPSHVPVYLRRLADGISKKEK